jgi:hypothetical protein
MQMELKDRIRPWSWAPARPMPARSSPSRPPSMRPGSSSSAPMAADRECALGRAQVKSFLFRLPIRRHRVRRWKRRRSRCEVQGAAIATLPCVESCATNDRQAPLRGVLGRRLVERNLRASHAVVPAASWVNRRVTLIAKDPRRDRRRSYELGKEVGARE